MAMDDIYLAAPRLELLGRFMERKRVQAFY